MDRSDRKSADLKNDAAQPAEVASATESGTWRRGTEAHARRYESIEALGLGVWLLICFGVAYWLQARMHTDSTRAMVVYGALFVVGIVSWDRFIGWRIAKRRQRFGGERGVGGRR